MLTAPSAVTAAAGVVEAGSVSQTLAKDVVTFSLVNGEFTFTTRRGELAGTYRGVVTVPTSGHPKVAMTLQVTEGSQELSGATGTLEGEGGGAFVTGGDFMLRLTGDVRTSAEPAGAKFQVTVVGEATLPLTCSANDRRLSRLSGEGTISTLGRSGMEFESEILETECVN
jgi:hypothetical protein